MHTWCTHAHCSCVHVLIQCWMWKESYIYNHMVKVHDTSQKLTFIPSPTLISGSTQLPLLENDAQCIEHSRIYKDYGDRGWCDTCTKVHMYSFRCMWVHAHVSPSWHSHFTKGTYVCRLVHESMYHAGNHKKCMEFHCIILTIKSSS